MATIDIKLSQAALDTLNSLAIQDGPAVNGTLGQAFDQLAAVASELSSQYYYYSSWNLTGSTLHLNYADGASRVYTGVTLADPTATHGVASASGIAFLKDGLLQTSSAGTFNVNYDISSSNQLTLAPADSTATAEKISTLLPDNSLSYDTVLGNVSIGYQGALHTDALGNASGKVTSLTETADKFVYSNTLTGNFDVSGNLGAIGQGTAHASVTGYLTSEQTYYRDGSHELIGDISTYLSATQALDPTMLADASRFGGDDVIKLDLPAHPYATVLMASGAGNDNLTLTGGGGSLNVDAGSGNDTIIVVSDTHKIEGGDGIDTVQVPGNLAQYTISADASGAHVSLVSAQGTQILSNVERVQFGDQALAFDIAGNAGATYRLYQAAFDRQPDQGGLSYWISVMDKGATLRGVADDFMNSTEFTNLYGSNPSDNDFLAKLYNNVLHRTPDQGGLDYWVGVLHGGTARGEVLVDFSESAENQAQVIGAIQHGIVFTPVH